MQWQISTRWITSRSSHSALFEIDKIPDNQPILIAGPTASGKSGLALAIAEAQGGVIVNADALQVFDCWTVLSARPPAADLARARHVLYGHVPWDASYSAGHWLRDVAPVLSGPDRPIIVGGTGLNFAALTEGLAQIPATPPEVRAEADTLPLPDLIAALDPETSAKLDLNNRMRVQRAWEVQRATGRSIAAWQAETPPPLLPLDRVTPLVLEPDKDWLTKRIARRFRLMLDEGALEEARAMLERWNPALPSAKAIGAPQLIAHLRGEMTLDEAEQAAVISTRQYAKRQRTWFRGRMKAWHKIDPASLDAET